MEIAGIKIVVTPGLPEGVAVMMPAETRVGPRVYPTTDGRIVAALEVFGPMPVIVRTAAPSSREG